MTEPRYTVRQVSSKEVISDMIAGPSTVVMLGEYPLLIIAGRVNNPLGLAVTIVEMLEDRTLD